MVEDRSLPVVVGPEKVGEEIKFRWRAVLIGTDVASGMSISGLVPDRVFSGSGQNGDKADVNSSRWLTLFPSLNIRRM